MERKAIIFGIKGYKITTSEKSFLKKAKPWGIILFSRNINNFFQLKTLVSDIKKLFNDKKFPILIDQEGGRVSRLNKLINLTMFSQHFFGNLFKKDKKLFYKVYNIYVDKICDIFNKVGININTVPVLDVSRSLADNFIGDRSFSTVPANVLKIGNLCIQLHEKNKVATVMKHIPGHGMTDVDSHFNTPITKNSKKNLIKNDFLPFRSCKPLFAMTSHIKYLAYDSYNTATHSKIVIKKVIRDHIGFKGILISDDISMKSLKYKLEENAIRAIDSGCNLILHCNGNIKEMVKLSKVVPNIDKFTKKKTSDFYKFLG